MNLKTYYANVAKRFASVVDEPTATEKFLRVYHMASYDRREDILGTPEECAKKYLELGDKYFNDFCAKQGEEIKKKLSNNVAVLENDFVFQNDMVATLATNRANPKEIYTAAMVLRNLQDTLEAEKEYLRSFENSLTQCQD